MADETYSYVVPIEGLLPGIIIRGSDDAQIPCALANQDYQAFLVWVAEGNPAPEGWTGPLNPTPEEVA